MTRAREWPVVYVDPARPWLGTTYWRDRNDRADRLRAYLRRRFAA